MKIFDSYGKFGSFRLTRDYLLTQIDSFFRFKSRIRLIRRPVYIRGRKFIKIGKNFTSGVGLRLDAFPIEKKICLVIGEDVEVNDYVHIGAVESISIGNGVLIASKVFITDHNHGYYGNSDQHDNPTLTRPKDRKLCSSSVEIQDNVWIGEFVTVLPGVTIGSGAIIGAMSVVTQDIPSFCIALGNPARVVKIFNSETKRWDCCNK